MNFNALVHLFGLKQCLFFFLTEEVISVFIVIYTQNHLESRKSLLKFKECLDNALKHVV